MEEAFDKVVHKIFNGWSALQLAVEHRMGGPNGRQTAIECKNYMVAYCLNETNIEVENIEEALEDILDEEFNTICEDGSPKEIAIIMYKFVQLLKDGNTTQCEIEYQNLPSATEWLSVPTIQSSKSMQNESDSSSDDEEPPSTTQTAMDEDGWTQVTSKRKR